MGMIDQSCFENICTSKNHIHKKTKRHTYRPKKHAYKKKNKEAYIKIKKN